MTTPHYPPRPSSSPPPPPASDDDDEVADEPPPDPDSIRGMFQNPGTRNYLFAGLGALAMVFAVLFSHGSDVGGGLVVLIGAGGLLLRWPAAPAFVLLFLLWFSVYPFGIPDSSTMSIARATPFQVDDVLLVASVVVYVACHFRVFGLAAQAMPFEQRFPKKTDEPTRRPAALVRPSEVARLLYVTAAVVVAGQVVWVLVDTLDIDVLADFPLRWARRPRPFRPGQDQLSYGFTRFTLTIGLLFFGTLLARLVFGYWRLRQLSPDEGRMVLQDAGWDETRRERTRQEKWRAWGVERARKRRAEEDRGKKGGTR